MPAQRGRRYFWPKVVVIVGALLALAAWAVAQSLQVEQVMEESGGTVSDHDSGIAARLHERQATQNQPQLHDPSIAARLREREARDSAEDAGCVQVGICD